MGDRWSREMQVAVRVSLPLNLPANRQAVTDMWSTLGGSAELVCCECQFDSHFVTLWRRW